MRNLLYLFNNGYKAFPHLGKGGLGYKPPIKIIGDGLHLVFNPETNKYDTIDDLDHSDSNIYNIDYGTPEYGDAILKRSENLLLEKERKKESLKKQEEGEKLIKVLEGIIYEDDSEYETSDDEDYKAMKILRMKNTLKPPTGVDVLQIIQKIEAEAEKDKKAKEANAGNTEQAEKFLKTKQYTSIKTSQTRVKKLDTKIKEAKTLTEADKIHLKNERTE